MSARVLEIADRLDEHHKALTTAERLAIAHDIAEYFDSILDGLHDAICALPRTTGGVLNKSEVLHAIDEARTPQIALPQPSPAGDDVITTRNGDPR